MVTANVDIPALKARHPLGDTVEASGVRLRGRGRVRQGVCPFHDEMEGSFTVYADSERWYCFGCGLGGDVLDFIQRSENLSLPDAIRRLDGGHRPVSGVVPRPAPAQASQGDATASEGPGAPDGGGSVLCRAASPPLRRSLITWPRGASGLTPLCGSASASLRAAGCGTALSRLASMPVVSGAAACSPSGVRSGSPGWWSFPKSPAGLSAGLWAGPWTRTCEATLPGPCPAPSRCLGLDASAPHLRGRSLPRASSTGLPLPVGASPAVAALGTQGVERIATALRGCPRVFLAFDNDEAGLEATERLAGLLGRRAAAVTLPQGVGDVAELASLPQGRAAFLRLLARAARSAR